MSLGHWQIEPIQVAPALVLASAYALRVRTLGAKGRPVRPGRQAAFYAGIAVILFALVSPIDYLGEERLLWVHMVQHLLLGDIAALLLVFGLTGPVLRPVLAIGWIRRLRWLAHPLVALPLWIVNLSVWHLRVLYQAALYHDGIHALEHFLFVGCGALMWAAVIEPVPGPAWFGNGWKAVYTLAVRTAGAIVANAFIWSSHPFYPYYAVRDRLAGISATTDQRLAGAIMFIEGSVVTMLAFAWLFIRFTREMELRQRLVERDVDATRAARAARYAR
ncbi:MAG TPA: cytochrome c oxidase assembly protein [Solirubrobacteraceae bacterium]|nr:cytochrome c oxidase assembly protein [Solirubrobacteraceae bacterium]